MASSVSEVGEAVEGSGVGLDGGGAAAGLGAGVEATISRENPFLWSFGDEVVTTIMLFSLARTIFYVTRSRTGRPVKKESAAILLKYWCTFFSLRLIFELFEDFAPGIVHIRSYQFGKIAVFGLITILSLGLSEMFYTNVLASAFDEREEEIKLAQTELRSLRMQLHSHLIELLEFVVGWLKRRFIMEGGSVPLETRNIVLDPAEAQAMNGNGRPETLPRLPRSMEPGLTFFSGGEDIAERGRGASRRRGEMSIDQELNTKPAEAPVRMKRGSRGLGGTSLKEKVDPYEKVRQLRKQMKEGVFKSKSSES